MLAYLKKVSQQIATFFNELSPRKKLALGGVGVSIVVVLIGLFMWAGEKNYQPLMSNVNQEDAANIIRILREKRIPFRVDPSGRNISIPPEYIYDLRLELASMGMPQSGSVGYEVFDKQSFGTTSYVQKLNQKRALEGELMRTINAIKGVKRSRVHLAIPQKSTFIEDQKKASASVVLDLDAGVQLSDKQIFGVGTLVARAVEGLDQSDVVIVDASGKLLSRNVSDPLAAASANQMDFRFRFEQETEKRVESMLTRVVGEGKVVAKVTADFDFSQISETQTTYDQDGATLRSTEKRNDSLTGSRPAPGGAMGAVSNTPGVNPAPASEIKNDTNKTHEIANYEIPQTVKKTIRPSNTIRKLSVAVVVDGKQVKTTDKNGVVQSKVEPWPADKLKEFEDVVASAVGIDKKRGDVLEVKNMEFTHEDFEEATRLLNDAERRSYLMKVATYGVIGLLIGLFFLLVVRPFVKWVTENTIDSVDSFLPQTIEELERMQKGGAVQSLEEAVPVLPDRVDPEKVEGEMLKDKITSLVEANPHKAAHILRDWLHTSAANPADKKDAKAGAGEKGKPKTA